MEIETGSESVTEQAAKAGKAQPTAVPRLWSESPRGARHSPAVRRVLVASVAGCVVLGGVVVLLPGSGGKAAPPALGPAGRAMAAAGAGAPAALPDLTVLIGEREAHLRRHPGDDESWAVLGAAYVERGLRTADSAYYPKAEKALRTSLRTRPEGNTEALTGMATLANARHDFRGAKKWAEGAVRLAPKRWSTYPALIEAYSGLGDAKGVGKALETLQELNADIPSVMVRSGQVYRDRGWREDAAAKLTDAAALAEGPAEKAVCLYRVGELAWERGDPPEALRYYEAALVADPDHHPSLAGKGRALAALGRTSEALRSYQSALLKQPAPEYALELGELYESLRLAPAARAQYDVLRARVKQEGVNGVNDERILGLFEADHGDADAAVDRLRAEFKRHASPQVADALGWALHRSGEDKEALKFAKRATDKGPLVALYAYHRGQIERDLGQYGAARRHIGEAMRRNPYFSPLLAPAARAALTRLGDPPSGGPAQMYAPRGERPAPLPSPSPKPRKPSTES
ncbi:tetratricopeptide repeat protein [Streptomyces sp. NPDC050439]|uniref:tetratricopeptide repeat protein n=1 Tax=unclassified Streptomyces TaxID=2593676 RepID=UPI003430A29D